MSRERYSRSERIERDRFADERDRFEERDRVYSRGPREPVREHSVDDRFERRAGRRAGPPPFDDDLVRDRRFYDEYDKFGRRPGPPPPPIVERELRRQYRSPSPPQRPPVLLRRQSSLDTFDRRPSTRLFDQPRAYRYGPPARRDDYVSRDDDLYDPDPLPLTRSRGQPARRRDYYDEIGIAEPDFYGDDEFRPYPERIREREVVRTRHEHRSTSRDRSTSRGRSSRGRSRRGGSTIRSLSISSSSSSSSSDVTTVRSEYPKKGKTRIPARLVSRKALIDLGYPFVEEVRLLCP